jgi:hypothetical protein
MYLTFAARAFVLPERTFVKTPQSIFQQILTVEA